MGSKCNLPLYKIISEEAINKISNASFDILENVGVFSGTRVNGSSNNTNC